MARACQRCSYENQDEAKFCLQCGAMLEVEVEDASDPLIGKILLGRYRIVKMLGEGGMGRVYLAEQKMGTATRKVAIKTLHPELSTDAQLVARFHRECETVIELHHPNTVQFYDFGELDDKTLFIVMEYIEGEDLSHRLQRGVVDAGLADKLLIQICGSLHEAHQRGIVHRDLKPENVLLTSRGGQEDFVKVLDFGIAKRSEAEDDSKAKLTKQGMVLGTPPYMSPEQFSGQTLDLRSDIYSLGVMTYEMITGTLPFEARTPWEWATKHLTQPPTPIETHPAGAALPVNKRNAILRALAKNREERHPDVLSFMHEFTGIGDAQAAWTMATSLGAKSGSAPGSSPGGPVRPPVGTPQPMQAAGSYYDTPAPVYTPAAHPYDPSASYSSHSGASHPGSHSGASHPGSSHAGAGLGHPGMSHGGQPGVGYDPSSASMIATPSSGGSGKWIGLLLVVFVLLGGGVGGAIWFWSSQQQASANTTDPADVVDPNAIGAARVDPIGPTNPPTMEPSQVVDPSTMLAAGVDTPVEEPTMVEVAEPTMVEQPEETMEPTMVATMASTRMTSSMTVSPANQAAAERAVARGQSALSSGNLDGAIQALAEAQRAVGRSHASLRSLQSQIASRGAREVGLKVVNQCAQAQAVYRRLQSVGAERSARDQFYGGCARP